MRPVQLALILALGSLSAAEAVFAQDAALEQRIVAVVGEGEASAVPDLAQVTVGVTNDGGTAAAALQANARAVSAVLDLLRNEGIGSTDLQTTGLYLEPRYAQPSGQDRDRSQIVGYVASNQITIRVRDLTQLGGLLDRTVSAGATDIRGVRFDVVDRGRVLEDARTRAVEDARRRATLYASAGGMKLGSLISLIEEGGISVPRSYGGRAAVEAAPVPVEAGELTLLARIRATYKLVD